MLISAIFLLAHALQVSSEPEGQLFTPRISSGYGTKWAEAYKQARSFVCGLTITEKVNLTTSVGTGQSNGNGYNVGEIPRIGFPGIAGDDGPTGVRGNQFTSAFPAGLNLGMCWDRSLMYALGHGNGAEHKGKGFNSVLGPVVGPLGRTPTGGRNAESYSPDPYLSGIAFGQGIAGMQDAGAIAVGKHYIMYEQERFREVDEWNDWRAGPNITEPYSSNLDDRTFHELYLWPWYDAVKNGMAGVMCSYNQVNNTQVCQNNHLLNDILKGELGFQGYIQSDDGSQHDGVNTALGGMDQTGPGETSPNGIDGLGISFWGANLTLAVLNGSVPYWRLDDMAIRIMASHFYLNQSEGYPARDLAQTVNVQGNHGELIRQIGAQSVVMLKNTGTLPLVAPKRLGLFGEDAGPISSGLNGCQDQGCLNGTLAMLWGSGSTNFPYLIDPLAAIQQRAVKNGTVVEYILDNYAISSIDTLAARCDVCLTFINSDSGEGYLEIDSNYGDRNNLTAWKNGDALVQRVAAKCSQTVVIVHSVGAILMEQWINHPNVTAVLFAGLPGQESGNSLTDVLYGDVNPSGKLPFTVAKQRQDYGVDVLYRPNGDVPQINFTEGLFIDYRYFDKYNITPRFEFGFGLSYTTFEYSSLHVQTLPKTSTKPPAPQTTVNPQICLDTKPQHSDYLFPSTISSVTNHLYPYLTATPTTSLATPTVTIQPRAPAAQGGDPALWDNVYRVTATIRNTGKVAGKEVAQLYLNLGNGTPARQLRGFDKILLNPGQSKQVTFNLRRRDVSIWDIVSQKWVEVTTLGTTIDVFVGASSRNLPLQGQISSGT